MESLADKIRLAKDGDEKAMLDIIERFEPLIGKYTRLLNYDNEDCRSDLIEKLITLVKVEIDLGKLIVIDGYTAESVSKRFGVTKQSVNQCKNRGLEKLKKIYI